MDNFCALFSGALLSPPLSSGQPPDGSPVHLSLMRELIRELSAQFIDQQDSIVIIFVNTRAHTTAIADYLNSAHVPEVVRRATAHGIVGECYRCSD
jgi:hypothetical protein